MKNSNPALRPHKTVTAASEQPADRVPAKALQNVSIRNDLLAGDLGWLIHLHGTLYAAECGWDRTFEAYVAAPLAQFALTEDPRNRIWVVEHRGRVAGSIAIAGLSKKVAQLRWFLLHPRLRGQGLGKRLLAQAISFSRQSSYARIELWTTSNLRTAAHLYQAAGFELTREITHPLWGGIVTEQQYELRLCSPERDRELTAARPPSRAA